MAVVLEQQAAPGVGPDAPSGRSTVAVVGAVLALASCAPYLLGGHGTRVRAWDNLDSNWVWYELQHRAGSLTRFGGEVSSLMGGVPAEALGSDFYVPRLLVGALGLVPAYIVSQLLVHVVAYVGMLRLLNRLLGREHSAINVGVAVVFAWVPFWPPAGLSIAGLPLLASAYLAARSSTARRVDWLILLAFPFYSMFVYTAPFVAALVVADLAWTVARRRPVSRQAVLALAAYGAASIVAEVELLAGMIFDSWETHRLDWVPERSGPWEVLRDAGGRLLHGTDHTMAGQGLLLMAVIGLAVIASARSRQRCSAVLRAAAVLAAVLALLASLENLALVASVREQLGSVGTLQWRFDWLVPPVLFVALAAGFVQLRSVLDRSVGAAVMTVVLMLQWFALVDGSEWKDSDNLTFDGFYAPAIFDQIRQDIDLGPGERVGSVGLHPAIAQHAGMPTVDGYLTSYPLTYKRAFRRIIDDELEGSELLRSYFDGWGSRAYLFASALPPRVDRPGQVPADAEARFDVAVFEQLGGRYVLSSTSITNHHEIGLALVGVYSAAQSPWQIRVYEVL